VVVGSGEGIRVGPADGDGVRGSFVMSSGGSGVSLGTEVGAGETGKAKLGIGMKQSRGSPGH